MSTDHSSKRKANQGIRTKMTIHTESFTARVRPRLCIIRANVGAQPPAEPVGWSGGLGTSLPHVLS